MGKWTPASSTNAGAGESTPGGSISRRDFVYLNTVLIAAAGIGACGAPEKIRDERRSLHVTRPEDLLSLRFDLDNLRIEHRRGSPGFLVRDRLDADAYLRVNFPAQHIQEQTFKASATEAKRPELPVKALAAKETQLVFRLPEDVDSIELSINGLLNWDVLEPVASYANSNEPASRVEMPFGLRLDMSGKSAWLHSPTAVTHNGLTELWHTRLRADSKADRVIVQVQRTDPEQQEDFNGPLSVKTREQLAGRQADVHELILSPLGGWLDLKGQWEADPEISRLELRTRAAQDQKVLVESAEGFIYPFGHRATQLEVSERKIESVTDKAGKTRHVALLRKRRFIVLKEATRTYKAGLFHARSLTAKVMLTPALAIEASATPPFWIETAPQTPFEFRFEARGWDNTRYEFTAPALFVSRSVDLAVAAATYDDPAYAAYRTSALGSVQSAVAPFLPVQSHLDSDNNRTSGDTSLLLLHARFAASEADGDTHELFDCKTEAIEVRVPSLQDSLEEAKNRGWFELRDPDADGNKGEVYAVARSGSPKIPLYFDQNPGASGALAAPSFDVDGLSRVHGPIANAAVVMDNAAIDDENYFKADKAQVLGVFPLAKLLFTDSPDKPPAIPKIYLVHKKLKKKKKKDAEKDAAENEEKDEEKPDDEDNPGNESEESKKDEGSAGREVGLGLKWTVPLQAFGSSELVAFEPTKDDEGKSKAKLEIDVKASRVVGAAEAQEDEAEDKDDSEEKDDKPGVAVRATGKLSDFSLVLSFSKDTALSIGFDHISVALGPAKKESTEDTDKPSDSDDADEGQKKRFDAEVEFKLAEINATGALNFIKGLMEMMAHLPPLPDIPRMEPTAAYPAKMPAPGKADLSIPLGPFDIPAFKWLNFEVSNLSVGGSIGLNFKPRVVAPETTARVQDHEFSIRLASVDKPLTLLAEPWGGIAHLGLNFTPKRLTAFQFSLGVLYKTEFDLKASRATCEGSLAGMYTYWIEGGEGHTQIELILRVGGKAKLWFMDIQLLLVAVGAYHLEQDLWAFSAELIARVQIAFFAVEASFVFYYEIAGDSAKQDRLAGAAGDDQALTEDDWLRYQAAFAAA